MTFIIGEKKERHWHVYSTCWGGIVSIAQVENKEDAVDAAMKILKRLGHTTPRTMDYNTPVKFRFSYF